MHTDRSVLLKQPGHTVYILEPHLPIQTKLPSVQLGISPQKPVLKALLGQELTRLCSAAGMEQRGCLLWAHCLPQAACSQGALLQSPACLNSSLA